MAYSSSAIHRWLHWPALVVGGVIPDIDFVMLWAPGFNTWHRVVTHNVFFVASVVVLGTLFGPRRWRSEKGRVAAGLALGGLLHLCVDSVMDGNPSNGIGVAWLWPIVEQTFSPFNVIAIHDDPPTWAELDRMIPAVLGGVVFELPFYVAAAAIYFLRRRKPRPIG